MRDDAALVELAQAGDASAFAELYERYFDGIHDFLARMVRDRAEASDVAQDTFLRAMNSLPTLANDASFKSWLFTIARNTALDRLERSARVQPLERTSEDGEEFSYDVVDADRFGSPQEAVEAASLAALVWEAAEGLEPRQYSVLHLAVREGLGSAEIADVLGVTRNNAYVLVNRMKQSLEAAIGALALLRSRRQHCAELDAALARLETATMAPDTRRVIERHASGCPACRDQRSQLASPFAVFAALAPLEAEGSTKAAILGRLNEALASQSSGGPAGIEGGFVAGDSVLVAPEPERSWWGAVAGGFGNWAGGYGDLDESAWWRRKSLLAAIGALALLLIGGPVTALALLGGDGGAASTGGARRVGAQLAATTAASTPVAALVKASMTPTAVSGSATPTPTPAVTATASVTPPLATSSGSTGPSGLGLLATGGTSATSAAAAATFAETEPPLAAPPAAADPPVSPPPSEGGSIAAPASAPCRPSLAASPRRLTLDGGGSGTVSLRGDGCGAPLEFTAWSAAGWISVSPSHGRVHDGASEAVTVTVDHVDAAMSGSVRISSDAGIIEIAVTAEASAAAPPTDTPAPTATPTRIPRTPTPTPPQAPGGFATE